MTWRHRLALGIVLYSGLGVACASAPKATDSPAQSGSISAPRDSISAPAALVDASPRASASSSSSSSERRPPPTVAAPAPIMPICQAKCDKLVSKCSPPQVDSCRLNCSKYDPAPAGCDALVRSALECARDARDLTCANVAPESCSAKFRQSASCAAGESTQTSEAAPARLPEGWERVTDYENGFALAMPRGSIATAGPEGPLRSVTGADGTVYSVSVLPLLKEPASQKSLFHFLIKVQGRCSDKVKLDGFIERPEQSSIHFSARCPDQTDWDGMIYVNKAHLFMLSARAATGNLGITDPFFYEFESIKP